MTWRFDCIFLARIYPQISKIEMLEKLVSKLGSYVESLQNKTKATQLYDEALAHYSAKKYRNAFPIMREATQLGEKNAMGGIRNFV